MKREDFYLLQILIYQAWLKYFKEPINFEDRTFTGRANELRRELQNHYRVFKGDVEDGKGFRDNIKAVFYGEVSIKHPLKPLTIEALCLYVKDVIIGDDIKIDDWKLNEAPSQKAWQEFKQINLTKIGNFRESIPKKLMLPDDVENLQSKLEEEQRKNRDFLEKLSQLEIKEKQVNDVLKEEPLPFKVFSFNFCSLEIVIRLTSIFLTIIIILGILLCFYFPYQLDLPIRKNMLNAQKEVSQNLNIILPFFSGFQVVMLIALLFSWDGNSYIKKINKSIIKQILLQFQAGWLSIWISSLFLYCWFTFKWIVEIKYQRPGLDVSELDILNQIRFSQMSWVITDVMSSISSVLFFYIYYILDLKSLNTVNEPSRNKEFIYRMKIVIVVAIILLITSILDRLQDWGELDNIGVLIYSLFPIIGMSMFFGRLNSHFFNSKRELVPIFYLYAGIQAGYAVMHNSSVWFSALIFLILIISKILLFIEVNKLIERGNFTVYIKNMLSYMRKNDSPLNRDQHQHSL